MNPRTQRLVDKVQAKLGPLLEPGERPEVILQAITRVNPWVTTAIVAVIGVSIAIPLGISGAFGSFWLYVLLGAFVGGVTGYALLLTSDWVVLTDRRLLLVGMSAASQTPTRVRTAAPRSAVSVDGPVRSGGLGYGSVPLKLGDERVVLRVNRLWREPVDRLVAALSGLAPPPPPPA